MADRNYYFFNTRTLSFEKSRLSVSGVIKRILWIIVTAIAFSVLVLWISFYVFSSPKEKKLEEENNKLKLELKNLSAKVDNMNIVLEDIEERDDNVYRAIFETNPIPLSVRRPSYLKNVDFQIIDNSTFSTVINSVKYKIDLLTVRLAIQSKSLDSLLKLAFSKEAMLAAIPAIRPLNNMKTITSGFGSRFHPILKIAKFHSGVDIATPNGTPVYATADGVVSPDDGGQGYGTCIVINHGYSYQTLYAHLSKKNVKIGQKVKRGQLIGYSGNTGLSYGPHLHYEVIKNGQVVNPVHYFFSDITPEEYELLLKSSKEMNQSLS